MARSCWKQHASRRPRFDLTFERSAHCILSSFPPEVRRTTRATELERNRLVLALSTEAVTPYVAEGSPLTALFAEQDIRDKA